MTANSLTPEEKQPFVDAAEKIYPMFEKDFGEEVMEILKQVRK